MGALNILNCDGKEPLESERLKIMGEKLLEIFKSLRTWEDKIQGRAED